MPDIAAGHRLTTLDFLPTFYDEEEDSYSFTISTYGVAASAGTYIECGGTFVAPYTGKVLISHNAQIRISSGSGSARVAPAVREGAVVGSGSAVLSADDDYSTNVTNTTAHRRHGVTRLLSGLVAGDTYNIRLEHAVSGGATAETLRRSVTVAPAT